MRLVARIALVSPSRASQVENGIIRLMQMGHIRGRVTEQQLIQLLEQVSNGRLLRCLCVNYDFPITRPIRSQNQDLRKDQL